METTRILLIAISMVFTIGFVSPAFAILVQFDHTVPPDDWYYVEHGAVMTVDASVDPPFTDPNTFPANTIQTVSVRISATGGDFIDVILTETSATSGFFTFPTYIMFTSGANNQNTPALHVDVNDRVTTVFQNPPPGLIPIEEDVGIKATDEGYPPPANPNQPNKSVKLTGTDSDVDGIVDSWETTNGLVIPYNGITYTYPCNSSIQNDCPVVGKKDIYVEIDWMRRHAPDQNAFSDVINAFQTQNINLHIQTNEEVPLHRLSTSAPAPGGAGGTQFDTIKNAFFGTSADRTNGNFLTAKRQVFHYALFAHNSATGVSGTGEIPGNDIMISLGNWAGGVGSRDQQAGTFMHELGHNLKLFHGGNDNQNCKPNYLSVMSFSRQFSDYVAGRPLTFSWGINNVQLTESSLTESTGIGTANAGQVTVFGGIPVRTAIIGSGIDWDRDTVVEGAIPGTFDLNNFGVASGCDGVGSDYNDWNDWGSLVYNIKTPTSFGDGAPSPAGKPPGSPFIVKPADEVTEAGSVRTDYVVSAQAQPDLKFVEYEQDSSMYLTAMEEQKGEPASKDESCECEGLTELLENDTMNQIKTYNNPEPSEIPEEMTIENSREFRALHVSTIDAAIDNLEPCYFKTTKYDSLECSGDAAYAKESLRNSLMTVSNHIKNGEDYAAIIEIQKVQDEARNLIKNPFALQSISAQIDRASSSLKVVSEAPKWDRPTLKELKDEIKAQSTAIKNAEDLLKLIQGLFGLEIIPTWIIALVIGFAIAVGVFIALTVMYRGRWNRALGGGRTRGQGTEGLGSSAEQKT